MDENKIVGLDDYVPTFPQAWNKLCPQGWAWLIGDCDFGQNCGSCKENEAPIYAKNRIQH